ncbi:hypothetical protein [Streptomyces sp. NPDC055287]
MQKMPEVSSAARMLTTAALPPDRVRGELVQCAGPGEEHVFRQVAGESECGECRRATAAREAGLDLWPRVRTVRLPWRERVTAIQAGMA